MIKWPMKFSVFVLILALLVQVSVLSSDSSTAPEYTSVIVSNGDSQKRREVLKLNGDIYFPAEQFASLAKCGVKPEGSQYIYTIGKKQVCVDTQTGNLKIEILNVSDNVGKVIYKDGKHFISASQLLPWLNVSCEVTNDGALLITPDKNSLWRVKEDIDSGNFFFDVGTLWGDSLYNKASLEAVTTYDAIIHFRFSRLIPSFTLQEVKEHPKEILSEVVGATLSGGVNNLRIFKNHSVYDFNCYVKALSDFGVIDELLSTRIDGNLDNLDDYIDAGSTLGDLSSYFQEFLEQSEFNAKTVRRMGDMLSKFEALSEAERKIADMATIAFDDDAVVAVQNMLATWKGTVQVVKGLNKVHKYFNIFSALKVLELTLKADSDYRDFVNWCSGKDTGNRLLNRAIKRTSDTLNTDYTVYNVYRALGESILNAVADDKVEDALGDAALYIKVAKLFYDAIFPNINSGFEGIAKWNVYEAIQDYFSQLSKKLMNEPMTTENIMRIRQSLIIALKSSKECYAALDKTSEAKLFRFIDVFGSETGYVGQINDMIMRLYASSDTVEHDSAQSKDVYLATVHLTDSVTVQTGLLESFASLRFDSFEVSDVRFDIKSEDLDGVYTEQLLISAYTDDALMVWTYTSDVNYIYSSQEQGMGSGIEFNGNQVVFASNGHIYSLDKQSGTLLWDVDAKNDGSNISSSLQQYGDYLYYCDARGRFFIVDTNGSVIRDYTNANIPSLDDFGESTGMTILDGGILKLSFMYYPYSDNAYVFYEDDEWGGNFSFCYDPFNDCCLETERLPNEKQDNSPLVENEETKTHASNGLIQGAWMTFDDEQTYLFTARDSGECEYCVYGAFMDADGYIPATGVFWPFYGSYAVINETDDSIEFEISLLEDGELIYTSVWMMDIIDDSFIYLSSLGDSILGVENQKTLYCTASQDGNNQYFIPADNMSRLILNTMDTHIGTLNGTRFSYAIPSGFDVVHDRMETEYTFNFHSDHLNMSVRIDFSDADDYVNWVNQFAETNSSDVESVIRAKYDLYCDIQSGHIVSSHFSGDGYLIEYQSNIYEAVKFGNGLVCQCNIDYSSAYAGMCGLLRDSIIESISLTGT